MSDYQVFHRKVRPLALILTVATGIRLWALTPGDLSVPTDLVGFGGAVISTFAIASIVMIWAGWWAKQDWWLVCGLLMTFCVQIVFAGTVFLSSEENQTLPWMSLCWAFAAGTAWWLEARDGEFIGH